MLREPSRQPARTYLILATILGVVAACGVAAAAHFSVIDDEANAISNASAGMAQILSKGLGHKRQFHPPMAEIIMHGWTRLVGGGGPLTLRIPAITFWVGAVAALFWALRPIASDSTRLAVAAMVALWPTHLVLPFMATWYSLAALLGNLTFGCFLRVLAEKEAGAKRAAGGAVVAGAMLAYTVFAWPFVLLGQLIATILIFGTSAIRARKRVLVWSGVALTVTIVPTLSALLFRVGPMLRRQAGGSPMQSVGAMLGLLVGHSAPATPWIVFAVVLSLSGIALGAVGAGRRSIALLALGVVPLACLAVTNTLNDKRVLLGSCFVPAALALRADERIGRISIGLCLLAAVPAWLGWTGIVRRPWIFPRWQDPIEEIATLHASALEPCLLITSEPEIAFYAAARAGDPILWHPPDMGGGGSKSLRWRPGAPETLLSQIDRYRTDEGTPLRTIDLVMPSTMQGREQILREAFEASGWKVTNDQKWGSDPLGELRHPGVGVARFWFIRFDRGSR